jgi:ABC-type lipoprotein release transport system permease subunit
MIAQLRLLVRLALRNLLAHKIKSLIVGSILFFGTFLVVLGSAILDSMEESMAKAITSSLSGHLQVYSDKAEDPLALFGGFGMGQPDIGEIESFGQVEGPLEGVDNVKSVVPMGVTIATVFGQTELDQVLNEMREAVRNGETERLPNLETQVKRIATTLMGEIETRAKVTGDPEKVQEDKVALEKALSDTFWTDFETNPMAALDFLDSAVAPQSQDGRLLYLRIIGTDPEEFRQSFDRFYIADGTPIPPGQRGFLFSKRTYEKLIKNLVARELDDIKEQVQTKHKVIADEPLIQAQIERLSRQYPRIVFQLSPDDAKAIEAGLRAKFPDEQGGLNELVSRLLKVDDSTLAGNYALFYELIAPRIKLYDIAVGDTITLRAYTKAGYVRSVNLPVYGTYDFQGLETSDLASASNITDLVTFRELYGKMSASQQAELKDIAASVGAKDVSRENAEAELFGGTGGIESTADDSAPDLATATSAASFANVQGGVDTKVYSPDEMRNGLALNAAVILKDPSRILETTQALIPVAKSVGLQVVDWKAATGIVGQFVLVMRLVLVTALFIIFIVALLIINNAMVLATLERTSEIGTMRAIGAQRGMVVALFLVETIVLGLIAGTLGAVVSTAFVSWLHAVGIPAFADQLILLFAGPRLFPTWTAKDVLLGVGSVVTAGVVSTLYPAFLAARIQPVVAMQKGD